MKTKYANLIEQLQRVTEVYNQAVYAAKKVEAVIDDLDDAWTSLLPQSSKFWKRKYDRLAKEKADMEAAYEREVKRLRASYLPVSRALDDCF